MYMAFDDVIKYKMLDGKWMDRAKSEIFIKVLEFFRKPMRKALRASNRFSPPYTIKQIAELTKPHASLGNMAGEGWFLTGEMAKLIQEGVKNIICLQPFGCLPNHVVGRGISKKLKEMYPDAQILPLDYDPDVSFANIENRLQMLIMNSKSEG